MATLFFKVSQSNQNYTVHLFMTSVSEGSHALLDSQALHVHCTWTHKIKTNNIFMSLIILLLLLYCQFSCLLKMIRDKINSRKGRVMYPN